MEIMGSGMSLILPGLYVGSFSSSRDLELLRKNKVTHVVSVHDNAKPLDEDFEYLCIIVSDKPEQSIIPHFSRVNHFIHTARLNGGVVLVHCLAGVSRSVTLTAAYVMSISDMGWKDSLNVVRAARRQANPNFGFKMQLKEFESHGVDDERVKLMSLYSENAETITREGDAEECRNLLERFWRWVRYGDRLQIEGEFALVEKVMETASSPNPKKSHSADGIIARNGYSEDADRPTTSSHCRVFKESCN